MYAQYAADPQMRLNRRHPPPARAADGEQPPPHRADEQPAASRCRARRSSTTATRSGWATTSISAIATASARRCSGAATATPASRAAIRRRLYFPVDHGPGLRVRGDQRRGAGALAVLAAALDEADDRAAPAAPGVRPRVDRVHSDRQPQGADLRPPVRERDRPVRGEPLARTVQPVEIPLRAVRRPDAGRDARADASFRGSATSRTS